MWTCSMSPDDIEQTGSADCHSALWRPPALGAFSMVTFRARIRLSAIVVAVKTVRGSPPGSTPRVSTVRIRWL